MSVSIFISWSGKRSKSYAYIIKELIEHCFTNSNLFISEINIAKGDVGFSRIASTLSDAKVGIICLTNENVDKPWICYEAGALANGTSAERVCPLLIDIDHVNSRNPISQFQHTKAHDRSDVRLLLETINNAYGDVKREAQALDRSFALAWDNSVEKLLKDAKEQHDHTSSSDDEPVATPDQMIGEILEIVRDERNLRIRNSQIETWKSLKERVLRADESLGKSLSSSILSNDNSMDSLGKYMVLSSGTREEILKFVASGKVRLAVQMLSNNGFDYDESRQIIQYIRSTLDTPEEH